MESTNECPTKAEIIKTINNISVNIDIIRTNETGQSIFKNSPYTIAIPNDCKMILVSLCSQMGLWSRGTFMILPNIPQLIHVHHAQGEYFLRVTYSTSSKTLRFELENGTSAGIVTNIVGIR